MTTIAHTDTEQADDSGLLELISEFNADAKTISRRGYVGTASTQYDDVHEALNECLDAMGL